MREAATRPSFALRVSWLMRLAWMGSRRHLVATILAGGAFGLALVTVALVVAVAGGDGSAPTAATGNVELVAFLRPDLSASTREDLVTALGRLPGVAAVQALGSDERMARARVAAEAAAGGGERAAGSVESEEGALPATLEVSLRSGLQGDGQADAIAWRLRRMAGIADVDVLRGPADDGLARVELRARRLRRLALGLGAAIVAGALAFATAALRRGRRGDARLLGELGFTADAITAPAALAGAGAGLVGAALASLVLALVFHWGLPAPIEPRISGVRAVLGMGLCAITLGGALGWWGARPSNDQIRL